MLGRTGELNTAIQLNVRIRPCTADDLVDLEWHGMFRHHREIIEATFERHRQGDVLMLVADANSFPVGQVWIDFVAKAGESCAVLWALRVLPGLQREGLGTRLIGAAERAARARGLARMELSVERDNEDARRLYERLGYHLLRRDADSYSYRTPDGVSVTVHLDQWVLRKELDSPRPVHPS